jgi:peptidoglycan/xylan/chitin deacetylase (PgdA/CDA1 family)
MAQQQDPVILSYHSVGGDRPPLSISPSQFSAQMKWLSENARVISLAEMVSALKRRQPLGARTVVLTFDDGYEDFYEQAAPILRRWGFSATVFLPTAYCGRTNSWPGQPKWVVEKPLLTWKQIEELVRDGFQFGSHSTTHPDMARLPTSEAEHEILESKREIERHTGTPAEFFCYPYGRWNKTIREIVSQHFSAACSTAAGTVWPNADPYLLPRIDVHYLRFRACFTSLFTRRMSSYIALRRVVRRMRRQPEGYLSTL